MKLQVQLSTFLVLLNISISIAQTPNWAWAKNAGTDRYDQGTCVKTDEAGNIYMAGFFMGNSITLGNITLLNANGGSHDIFIIKYDPSGNVLWARSAGGDGDDDLGISGLALDASGNVYITGINRSPAMYFDNITLNNPNSSANNSLFFIAKYDASGTILWAKSAGGLNTAYGNGISCDPSGNIYVTGGFTCSSITFGNTTLNLSGSAGTDAGFFITKYSAAGNVIWAKTTTGGYANNGAGLIINSDKNANVYVAGTFLGYSIEFGGTILNNNYSGTNETFIVKYDSTGAFKWNKSIGGSDYEFPYSLSNDLNGNLCIAGAFRGYSMSIGGTTLQNQGYSGNYDLYVAKYNPNGAIFWAKSIGGYSSEFAKGICTDTSNNIYVIGNFESASLIFGTTTLTNAVTNGSTSDIFITKYDPSGNSLWAKKVGDTDIENGIGITTDVSGHIYVTGGFRSSPTNFGSYTLTNTGFEDAFIAKLIDCSNAAITASLSNQNNVSCFGGNNGSATILANGGTGLTYNWAPSGGNAATASNLAANTYTCTISNSCNITDTIMVVITQPSNGLTTSATANNTSICNGGSVNLTAMATGGTSPYTYSWSSGATTANTSISPNSTTTYTTTVTDAHGCIQSAPITITVNQLPNVLITSSNSILCSGQTAFLTASNASSYVWNTSATTTSISISPAITTTYMVTGTDLNGCVNTATYTQTVSACTNVNNIASSTSAIKIYPNPSSGKFSITTEKEVVQINIYNTIGQLEQIINTNGQTKTDIALEKSGLYLIQITSAEKTITEKVFITK